MADDPIPSFDLPPLSEKSGFTWVIIAVILVSLGAGAWWVFFSGNTPQSQGHATAVTALQQQLDKDRAALDAERDKAVKMTQQLEAMKQAYQLGQVPDKRQALDDYAKLDAARQRQVQTVKTLTARYNDKLSSLKKLQ